MKCIQKTFLRSLTSNAGSFVLKRGLVYKKMQARLFLGSKQIAV